MAVTITAPVGYHGRSGGNRAPDVRIVHDLLSRVPPTKGGAGASLNPTAGYSAQTDQCIYRFQQFHKLGVTDATVHPGQQTLALLDEFAKGGAAPAPRPGLPAIPTPAPQPGPGPDIAPLPLLAVMTSTIVGHGYVAGFDNKAKTKKGRFRVPLYRLRLGRADTSTGAWKLSTETRVMDFDAIRFGVAYDDAAFKQNPAFSLFRMQGPPVGEFVLSRASYLDGSWQLKPHYYIHVGPDDPLRMSNDVDLRLFGALGCIEICWPNRLQLFEEATRRLAFGNFDEIGFYKPEEADERITKAQSFHCLVEPAATPPLLPLTDFRNIGGPPPIRG